MARKKILLSDINEKAVSEFDKHLIAAGMRNEETRRTYTSGVRKILRILNKNWKELNKRDMDSVFSSDKMSDTSKAMYKPKLVKFLNFKGLNDLADYVKTLYDFRVLSEPTKTDDDILSKDEIKKLIDSAKNLRDKAIFELFLCGIRRKELGYLKIKNVNITESIIWVTVVKRNKKGKSKTRRVPIVADKNIITSIFPRNFVNFYNTHIFRNEPEKPVFYSHFAKKYGEPLQLNSINRILHRIEKKAGINKKLTPHILRHTAATYDGHNLTEEQLKLKYGWSRNSKMPSIYCHMTDEQLGDQLLKRAGISEEQIKKDSICPNCNQVVNINDEICKHCNYILDRELQQKRIEELEKDKEELNRLKNEMYQMNIKHTEELRKLKRKISNQDKKHKELYKDTKAFIGALFSASAEKANIDLDKFIGSGTVEIKKDKVYVYFEPEK